MEGGGQVGRGKNVSFQFEDFVSQIDYGNKFGAIGQEPKGGKKYTCSGKNSFQISCTFQLT